MEEPPNHVKCGICNRVMPLGSPDICDAHGGPNGGTGGLVDGRLVLPPDFKPPTPEQREAMRVENARLSELQRQQAQALLDSLQLQRSNGSSPESPPVMPASKHKE